MKKKYRIKNDRLNKIFTMERIICRIITSVISFSALSLSQGSEFFNIAYMQETSIISMFAKCALIFLGLSAINFLFKNFETDTWALMLFSTVCVIHWLMEFNDNSKKFAFMLAVIVIYSLFTVYFINKNNGLYEYFRNCRHSKIFAPLLCVLFGAVCCTVISIITCLRYKTFSSPTFDFGIWANMFYHMKKTGLPLVTCERNVLLSHFAVHLSPIYYLVLPFYAIFPSPLTLQVAQAVALASGVIPVMLLCRHFKLSWASTALIVFIYSFHPAITMGCTYDLHENCFLAPLLLWLFYFFEKEKYIFMYIFAFAVLMVKEDAAIYVLVFAVFLIFSKKKFLHGSVLASVSLIYFFAALNLLESTAAYYSALYANEFANPSIEGPMINRFDNLIFNKEEGLFGALKTALLNPGYLLTQLFGTNGTGWEKIVYSLQMLLPVGLIPFCTNKPSRYLLISPILINLLTQYVYQYDIGFQYHFGVTAFLIYATVLNVQSMAPNTKRTLLGIGAAACACIYLSLVTPQIKIYTTAWKENQETYTQMEEILDTLPKDASVVCTYSLLAHIADRDEVYDIDYHGDISKADYAVFDIRYGCNEALYQKYLDQGYTLKKEYSGLIMILEKAK